MISRVANFLQGSLRITRSSRSTRSRISRQCRDGSKVQTLLFERSLYTPKGARAWARRHNFQAPKVDITAHYIRVRQEAPSKFRRMRTVNFGHGIKAVVGWKVC